MDNDHAQERSRPSWLTGACPDWCTREHHEDDHVEDRIHQDDGIVLPAVVARTDPLDMRRVPVASELVVQRSQAVVGDATVWVFIGEAEVANRLTLAVEALPDLRAAL